MIVRTLASILNTAAHVKGASFESRRILLAADGLGYSLHDTLCKAGSEQRLEYKNHVETNYVIEGEGEVVNVASGQTWPLGPGTVYVLDPARKVRLTLTYPPSTGRNFLEVLRVIDSLQLTDKHKVATPVNWQPGGRAIIVPSLSDEDAKRLLDPS